MNVAFINPKGYLQSEPWMPLGAVQLATILAARHNVSFFDEEQFAVPERLAEEADVVCITGMSHQADGIKSWARRGREWGKRVIVGGVHVTLTREVIHDAIMVRGPGEEIVEGIVEGTEEGSCCSAPPIQDLDAFPFPDRRRFGWTRYQERMDGLPAIRVIAARGCPFACKYCCNRELTHGHLQLRKPDAIAREIATAQNQLGIGAVVFAMSVFTVNSRWAQDVCERLALLGVKWKATTRVDCVDQELLRIMEKSGCVALGFGVESGSDRVLKILNKGTNTSQARQAFAWAKEVQLPTFAMFMTHVPGETPETLETTRRFAEELAPPLGSTFQRFSPLPGSAFYDELEVWGKVACRQEGAGFGPVGFIPQAFVESA